MNKSQWLTANKHSSAVTYSQYSTASSTLLLTYEKTLTKK